ncbi:MAG: hypothetical protein ACLFM0_04330 [Spirochaetales bacterium]
MLLPPLGRMQEDETMNRAHEICTYGISRKEETGGRGPMGTATQTPPEDDKLVRLEPARVQYRDRRVDPAIDRAPQSTFHSRSPIHV